MGLMTDSVSTGQSIMKCLVACTILLLVVRFSQGVSKIIEASVGSKAHFESSTPRLSKLLECIAIHNGVIYNIYPDCNLTNIYCDEYGTYSDCSFWLYDVEFDHAGKWSVQLIWIDNDVEIVQNSSVVELHVYKETDLLSKNQFVTEVGNYVTIFPQNVFENITNCTLIHYNDGKPTENYNLLNTNQTNSGLELYEKCGMRLLVNESRYGTWNIIQNVGPYIKIKLDFEICRLKENNSSDEINLVWTYGYSAKVGLTEYRRVLYCTIKQPDGRSTVIQNDNCAKQVYPVSNVHEGLWEIQYLITGKIDLMKKRYNVQVIDGSKSQKINVTVNATDSRMVHLLCTHPIKYATSEFCLFTKPDGTVLNLPQAIGNNKYEYYGKGYSYEISQKTYSDCGLTIRGPSADDLGLWECSFGRNGDPYRASVSFFDARTFNITGAYVPSHIYVKRGDTFSIKCSRYAPLKYCRLYHTLDAGDDKHVLFFGKRKDRAAGICGATVKNADYEHAGYWSCLLGVVGGGEINIPNAIKVIVTESYLHPNQSVVKIHKDEKTTLTLNLLSEKYATIDYCRWQRPDGRGIHIEDSAQYSTSYGQKSCSLTINEYNVANIGIWTCYASLFDGSDNKVSNEEVYARITVIENDDNTS